MLNACVGIDASLEPSLEEARLAARATPRTTTMGATRIGSQGMTNYPAKNRYRGEVATKYNTKRSSSAKWKKEFEILDKVISRFEPGTSILDIPVGTSRFCSFGSMRQNEVLFDRIRMRHKIHVTENPPEQEASPFIECHRESCKRIITQLTTGSELTWIHFDTNQKSMNIS